MQHSENQNQQSNEKKCKCGAWIWPFVLVLAGAITLSLILKACNLKAGDGMLALTAQKGSHHGEQGHENDEHHEGDHTNTSNKEDQSSNHHETTQSRGSVDANGNFQYDLGKMIELKLQNGTILKVGENSTEAKLFHFLSDKNSSLSSEGNWFDFTNVNFKTGSEQITENSNEQLKNLAAIIKNFPTAKFKLGGYTDNTGNADANKALSQKRAENVARILTGMGISKDAITGAEGYGQEHPVASNDTPEGKAQNRRVSVNVKAK